ncbi:MAG: helix-turn-helix transcriptional regulator [Burkholderiales bacterium]|nr:helix-turn-helix transcriptional regulator [Burkholderiales bacterium]
MSLPAFRFGPHTLSPDTRTLEAEGRPVPLGARAFDVLLALVERRDRVVGKGELLEAVWPDTVVEENNLQVQISTLRKVLGTRAIATIPGRGYQFALPIEALAEPVRPAASATGEAAAHGLFGRDEDLRKLASLCRVHRVVTIAGPGGVGKTVLARALLAAETGSDLDSVFVELAALREPAQVLPAFAAALDLRLPPGDPLPALVAALAQRRLVAVLDNAEQLADATGRLVADVGAKAAGVAFIVTSQVPLRIHGEYVYRLEPLAARPAFDLFVARATAADRRFAASAAHADTIAAICAQLDGMPLAIELAAARVRELGVAVLRESLAERFRMIASKARTGPARQQSLRAALEWSHGLLDDDERALYRRLGVFSGGFTLPLALAVAGTGDGDWATVDRLASLAERSLVAVSADEPPRYALAETMRAYALELLAAAGETGEILRRHGHAVHAFFSSLKATTLTAADRRDAQRELDNARDAFLWARERAPALAIDLAAMAARFTVFGARRAEGLAWLASCEPLVTDAIPRKVRAEWWLEFARFRLFNRHPEGKEAARRALALYRDEQDDRGVAQALAALVRSQYQATAETRAALAELDALIARHPDWPAHLRYVVSGTRGFAAEIEGDYAAAMRHRKEEATFAAAMGVPYARNAAETNLIALLRANELYDEVRERASALLGRLRGSAETANLAYACLHLLDALLATGRLGEARSCAIEAWRACRVMNLPLATEPTALLAALDGRLRTAARLLGYARASYERRAFDMPDVSVTCIAKVEALLRAKLDDAEIALLASEGAHWSDDEAFRAAFESDE